MVLLRPLIFFPVVGAGLVYAAFFLMAGPRIMESNLLDLFKSNTQASPFSVLLSGVGQSAQNVQLMLKSAGSYLLLAAWFMCAGYAAQRVGHLKLLVWRRLLYGVVALLAGIGTILFLKSFYHFELQYRSLPLIYLTVGVLSILAYARSGRKVAELKLLALSLLSFLVVLRIILQVHAWHYGFYILVPGFIVYHVFFFRILPDLMRSKHAAVALYTGFTLVFLVLMADHFQFSRAMYQQRTLPVPSPRGEIRVFAAPNGQGVKALIEFFSEKTPPGTTLAVFPEGLMINFLSRRQNPLYYYSFLPQDMVRARVEQVMVDDMILKKPDYIVVLQRPVAEYGSRGFGVDYARQVLAYIEANYLPVAHTGPLPFASDNFSAVIFKRH
jgi:hypothetical protein